jgi:hypothetical protein
VKRGECGDAAKCCTWSVHSKWNVWQGYRVLDVSRETFRLRAVYRLFHVERLDVHAVAGWSDAGSHSSIALAARRVGSMRIFDSASRREFADD